jgi:hypothetical protein
MVEIGTSGWPWRASGIAIGGALAAEADGAHAVWFADGLPVGVDAHRFADGAGPLLPLIPDPTDIADPVVTAGAALLVTRRLRVGILGWSPTDPARAARTLASLADLAPGRATVALAGTRDAARAVAQALPAGVEVDLACYGGDPAVAAELGWGWIDVARRGEDIAKAAGDAGVTGPLGVHLPVVVHADPATARRAAETPLLRDLATVVAADGLVVGDPAALGEIVDDHIAQGVTRIVLEDLLPFGAPTELEGGRAALRAVVRNARLHHRDAGGVAT